MIYEMIFFIFLALALQFDTLNAEKELKFLQIIFRHGDRAPIGSYKNDPNADYVWPEGIEKLTKLGMKMHYMLGKHIRSMYEGFITSDPNEVKVNSSHVDRCIRSAQSHLAGLYEPDPSFAFDQSVHWQPIPVDYIPLGQDKILNTAYICPRAMEQEMKNMEDPTDKEKYKELFEKLTEFSGVDINTPFDAFGLFDTLFAEKAHNLIIPDWAETYWKDLKEIDDYLIYKFYNTSIVHRLRAGPFVEKLSEMMTNKINGNLKDQKVQIYSTHDSIVGLLLAALGLSNFIRPPYAATLLVELHEDELKKNFVRFRYLNSTTPQDGNQESHVLYIKGCPEFCPLESYNEFIKKKNLIPDNYEEECGIKDLKAMSCGNAKQKRGTNSLFDFFKNL